MKNSKGFTLIELLAVLILISIIVVISMPTIIHLLVEITLIKVKNYHLREIHHTQECYI